MRNAVSSFSFVACTLVAGLSAQAADPSLPQRAMTEMQGACTNFGWNMTDEFKLWSAAPVAVAARPLNDSLPALKLGQRYDVSLKPHPDVSFVAKPEQDRGAPMVFSALAAYTAPEAGLYRLSASNGLWIDAVRDGKVIPSSAFEMKTKCDSIFKSVAYRFAAGDRIVVQLSGSRTETVGLLITKWAD